MAASVTQKAWWQHNGWGGHAGGAGGPLEFGGGGAYCTSSSSHVSSAVCFRGRPRWTWRPRLNSSSSTVQKDPHSSSTLTKHLCRDRLVRMAPWESKAAAGRGGEAGEPDADAVIDRTDRGHTHTHTHRDRQTTQGGGESVRIKMKISHCGLWAVTERLLKSMKGRHPEQAGTLDRQWDGAAAASSVSGETDARRRYRGSTYPLIFWGRLFWNSISSTVHTAPFTFSTRTKHLWRLRLCRTAFFSWCEDKKRKKVSIRTVYTCLYGRKMSNTVSGRNLNLKQITQNAVGIQCLNEFQITLTHKYFLVSMAIYLLTFFFIIPNAAFSDHSEKIDSVRWWNLTLNSQYLTLVESVFPFIMFKNKYEKFNSAWRSKSILAK